jgi:hypothetical protein
MQRASVESPREASYLSLAVMTVDGTERAYERVIQRED